MSIGGILILVGVFGGVILVFVLVAALVDRSSAAKTRDRWGSGVRAAQTASTQSVPRARARRPAAPTESLAVKLVRPLSRLWPLGAGSQRQVRELLVHAGIREKSAVEIFTGAKLALALALPAGVAAFLMWRTARTDAGFNTRTMFMYCAGALIMGMMIPQMWLRSKAKKRIQKVRFSLPDVLDLLIVCVESGLGLDAALVRIGKEMADVAPEFCEELVLLNLEISTGKPRDECLRNLGLRSGSDEVEALAARVNQSAKYGTNLGESLRIHSESLRQKRRHEAEERAAKTTVKLLFPLIFFVFPAIFVVILGPAVVKVVEIFR